MCLTKVSPITIPNRAGVGYKCLYNIGGELYSIFRRIDGGSVNLSEKEKEEKLEIGLIYSSISSQIYHNPYNVYNSGFHIFKNIEDAKELKRARREGGEKVDVVEVEYWDGMYEGIDQLQSNNDNVTVVANKMRINKIIQ